MTDLAWIDAVVRLRERREPGVLVTVADVRGHAPRDVGAKMVVGRDACWGTIGGGNLEESAVARARALLAEVDAGSLVPTERLEMSLSDVTRTEHGRQCCGGEVGLLLEPLAVRPAVAVFGLGHVGRELARVLVRHDLELHLVDSRADHVSEQALAPLRDGPATVHAHHAPLPEVVLGEVPPGTHVLIMSHDHAEDFALCDAALRCGHLGTLGLIGSSAKWRRFEKGLGLEGHEPAAIARIRCPIGATDLGLAGKAPAVIALGVAVELLAGVRAGAGARR